MKTVIFLLIPFLLSKVIVAQTLSIEITDVRNAEGHLLLGLYTNDIDYQNRIAVLKQTVLKTKLKDGKVITTIEGLSPGVYGIALLDDEDWDRKMRYKYLFPQEGFAFSNYFHVGYSKPHFEDFRFELGKEDKTVIMKCKYL
ncbi:DUF2141 domain-containing protein [Flavobacteriales bacterium]|jgi:uncharacterized protein (DUF2141 family)|nr:DUF2141 domain-containing protein [Flavobacteriales bacterium]